MNVNRETKIGLAVIVGLLVIFSAALTWRLTRPGPAAVASAQEDEEQQAADAAPKEVQPQDLAAGHPKVLTPASTTDTAARRSPDDLGQWTSPGDRAKSGTARAGAAEDRPAPTPARAPAIAPPFSSDDRYSRSDDVRQTGAALIPPANRQAEPPAFSATKDVRDATAANERTAEAAAEPTGQASGGMRPITPPPLASAPSLAVPPTMQQDPRGAAPPTDATSASRPQVVAADASPADDSVYARNSRSTASDASALAAPSAVSAVAPAQPIGAPGRGTAGDMVHGSDAAGQPGDYEVQPNDSFWTISQRVYGSGGYFKALAEHNRAKVGQVHKLQPGLTISIPTLAQLQQTYPDLCPRPNHREAARNRTAPAVTPAGLQGGARTYVVQEGDTLFDIARNELGKASRWAEIYELNRDALGKDFDYLTPGMQLAMPAKAPREAIDRTARQPATGYQR